MRVHTVTFGRVGARMHSHDKRSCCFYMWLYSQDGDISMNGAIFENDCFGVDYGYHCVGRVGVSGRVAGRANQGGGVGGAGPLQEIMVTVTITIAIMAGNHLLCCISFSFSGCCEPIVDIFG